MGKSLELLTFLVPFFPKLAYWEPAITSSPLSPLGGAPIALSAVTLDGREYISRVIQPESSNDSF